MVKERTNPAGTNTDSTGNIHNLVLYNDDIHSFAFVIETLVEVCNHDTMQAEQCAWITHLKGKCPVHSGTFERLKPMRDELHQRGLIVQIEK